MKIRIKGNSIRFRLTRPEVVKFCKNGYIEERTVFQDSAFAYGVQMDSYTQGLNAEFKDNTIVLKVSEKMAVDWDTSEKIGFQKTCTVRSGDVLHLLLEKDFVCMDERGEDESDNYPNPKMTSVPIDPKKK